MSSIDEILKKGAAGERISFEEGVRLHDEADLVALGQAANERRKALYPDNVCTFVIDRNINFANACVADCSFCAFYRKPGHPETYRLPIDEILRRVQELVDLGGTQVLLQGGLDPELPLSFFEEMVREVRAAFPHVDIHSFSAPEIDTISQATDLSHKEVLEKLKAAGLDSLPGGGAEMLSSETRNRISPLKTSVDAWVSVHTAAHELGIKSTATMTYGFGETSQERVQHFVILRELEDKAPGFRAFIPWSFQRGHTALQIPPTGGMEYLRIVSLGRLMLDNIPSLQAGWVTEGAKLCQLALEFGANDFGGILIDEVVVGATGMINRCDKQEALRLIRDAGRIPAQRNTKYEILKIYDDNNDIETGTDLPAHSVAS